MPFLSQSALGVEALIAKATTKYEHFLLGNAFSPLFPELCPWQSISEIPDDILRKNAREISTLSQSIEIYRSNLTNTAGKLAPYLDATEEEIRELALKYARRNFPYLQKLSWAERLLGIKIPGVDATTKLARVNDARYWRRVIRTRILREREHFYLRVGLIGARQEAYVSDIQLRNRTSQLQRQKKWLDNTVIVPKTSIEEVLEVEPLTLAKIAATPRTRFAKLFTFTKAMDEIAVNNGLAAAMLTLTLEPEWHPNPKNGNNKWNGHSPRDGHNVLAKRWQSVLRDLDRDNVGVSGLRVVEPHKDSCPHWHIWILYRPEHEENILTRVTSYFPGKLKIRFGQNKKAVRRPDLVYANHKDFLCNKFRIARSKEGAQVELAKIDRGISNGASYAMKYLLKTFDAGLDANQQVGLFSHLEKNEARASRKEQQRTARRVDAYRALWGVNAAQLFGVAKCLSAWDELRRLNEAPEHSDLRELWVAARGDNSEGKISSGANQRGDAKRFIELLGGLSACYKISKNLAKKSVARLTEAATNHYGEPIKKTIGVAIVERVRARVIIASRVDTSTGEIIETYASRSFKRTIAHVRTKLISWILLPANMAGSRR